jgi:SPOR domain
MADDHTQRPIRASQPPVRNAPGATPAASSGNDPLAELARLIGQNDPFAEYGRDGRRAAAQAPAAAPAPREAAYADEHYTPAPAQRADYGVSDAYPQHPDAYPQQAYGTAPPAAASQARAQLPGYPPEAGYEHTAEYPTNGHSGAEDHDFYDDVPPRRRMGILAIAAVFALAVVGTAGAFGYRALFGSSGSNTPPPVIKADATPTKIVPAASSKDPKSGKLIYDRVVDRAQDEKLVSREEQPLAIKDKPAGVIMPRGQNGIQPALGSGVITTEPKKVHTIAIRPDGTAMADAASAAHAAPAAPAAAAAAPPAIAAAVHAQAPALAAEPAPRQAAARAEPPPRRVATSSSNAPLSLSPDAPRTAQPVHTQRPVHTAAVAAPTPIAPPQAAPAHSGGYAVQVSSQRSEADAQAAFHSLQSKFPSQLGGKQPLIHRVDLGAKGIYFRAMVGPFGSSEEASQFCSNLKAAGGTCFVQRN